MNNTLFHPSLALGAARMTLREANREFSDRLEKVRGIEHVRDEKSAERMGHALQEIGHAGFAFVRTEYAKKHSNVCYAGFEVRKNDKDEKDLSVLSILSAAGKQYCSWLNYKVSLHALERVQQRRLGLAAQFDYRLSEFADEFAPSLVGAYAEGVLRGSDADFASGGMLLATSTGALISVYDRDWQGRVGVTWLAMEQLRTEQVQARSLSNKIICGWLEMLGDEKKKQRRSFAGRNDRIELRMRDSVRSIAESTPN